MCIVATDVIIFSASRNCRSGTREFDFSYDVDPGTLSGVEAYSGNWLGSIDAYDYRQSTTSLWVNIEGLVDEWAGMLQVGNDHNERRPGLWFMAQ